MYSLFSFLLSRPVQHYLSSSNIISAQIDGIFVSLQSKRPVSVLMDAPDQLIFGLEPPVFLALTGSLSVLLIGAVIFAILLKRDMSVKRKMQGLSSAADIDAEATRDYQVFIFFDLS